MVKKKTARSRTAQKPKRASTPTLKRAPHEIAIRYTDRHEQRVRDALTDLGTVESHPRHKMLVVHVRARVTAAAVRTTLEGLVSQGLIEFTSPVLIDSASGLRQVLTDEIVLQLKPGTSSRQTLKTLKAEHDLEIRRGSEFDPCHYIAKVPKKLELQTLEVARSLEDRDEVEFASPNFLTQIKR
jgi:hypothetical protein